MEFVDSLEMHEQIILACIGGLLLILGYRIKKIGFFVIWFLIGYTLMTYLLPTISGWLPEVAKTDLFQILIPIGGGLILALLGFAIEKICVSGICFVLTMLITVQYFGTEWQVLAIGGVVGAVLAGLSVALIKPASIIATAIAGGYALTLALLALFPGINREIFYFPMIGGSAVVGSLIQFLTAKKS